MENNSCVSAPTPGLSNLSIPPKGGFEAKNCVGVPEPTEHCMARSNTALFAPKNTSCPHFWLLRTLGNNINALSSLLRNSNHHEAFFLLDFFKQVANS